MKLRGMTWWIDRWRQSTAYIDLTLEEQGAYRNLLEETWLRGGAIPNDPRVLARASGDVKKWAKVRAKVLMKFYLIQNEYRHETIDELMAKAHKNAKKPSDHPQKVTPLSRVQKGG